MPSIILLLLTRGNDEQNLPAGFVHQIGRWQNTQHQNDSKQDGNVIGWNESDPGTEGRGSVRHDGLNVSGGSEEQNT